MRNCGGCSRRELITGVVSGTGLNTARDIEEAVSTKARTAYDQNFARTMENGMADYELHMRAVKDELFGNLSKFHDPRGTLVEIGMGTGPNMRYYEGLNVVGVEPNEESHVYAYENATKAGVKSLECVKGFGEALPLPDASVDTVVSTLVMCTVDDIEATLAEVRRVLKPGGAYIFLDHVAAPQGTKRGPEETFRLTPETGTQRYLAPESMLHQPYNAKVDVYAWGLATVEMLTLERPDRKSVV